jgi:cytochrome c oxidase subunit 1
LIADKAALGLGALGALGAALAAGPLLVAGFADQPAASAVYDYDGPSQLWNALSTAGHALIGLVVLAFLGLALKALTGRGEAAEADPWQGHTLEWLTTSPPPPDNFVEPPTVMSPEPAYDLRATPGGER